MVQTGVGVGVGVGVAVAVGVIVGVRVGVDVGVDRGVGVGNVSLKAKASLRKPFPLVFEYPNPPNMTGSVPLVFQKAGPARPPGATLGSDSFNAPYTAAAFPVELPLIHAH
jgi:hypothetical protein